MQIKLKSIDKQPLFFIVELENPFPCTRFVCIVSLIFQYDFGYLLVIIKNKRKFSTFEALTHARTQKIASERAKERERVQDTMSEMNTLTLQYNYAPKSIVCHLFILNSSVSFGSSLNNQKRFELIVCQCCHCEYCRPGQNGRNNQVFVWKIQTNTEH